jgi:4'-phosphopantetheinyl transferase
VQESNILWDLPEEKRIGAFFRTWTRKEAYIKALGIGLSDSLNRFSVNETSPALLEHQDSLQKIESWQIHDIEISSAYSAAVAIETAMRDIRHIHLEPILRAHLSF